MAAGTGDSESVRATPFWRDERTRGLIAQVLVILVLASLLVFLVVNMVDNLRVLRVPVGFDFLAERGGIGLGMSLIPVDLDSKVWELLIAGALNTFLAGFLSIVFATALGFLAGVMRLSANWIVSRLAAVYIETLRNIPLLVQLLFWYFGVLQILPNPRESLELPGGGLINIRGLFLPRLVPEDGFWLVFLAFVAGIAATVFLHRWARLRQERTGQVFPAYTIGLVIVVLLPGLASLILGNPFSWEWPELKGFNIQGGITIIPELLALILGLSFYTAAFIAEIVRAGILAVSHGQSEAALALGLRPRSVLRLVIIPQALRVIVPPLTSQYLNIMKNSTLAVAVGYPDFYSTISTILNQTGRSLESIAIVMLFYLSISLSISLFMNWYNRRIALIER